MQYDFSGVDGESYITVDPGIYRCRIAEVRERSARDGSPQWSVRLEVVEGDFAGRTAAWDRLTWSDKGIRRVKKVLQAFGVDVKGVVEIEPRDLEGREAVVHVVPDEYENPVTGAKTERLVVPYEGYGAVPDGTTPRRAADSDLAGFLQGP